MFSKKFYRYFFLKLIRQKNSPKNLAMSACASFILAFFIPIGFQLVAAFLVALATKLNKFVLFSLIWVTNPVTIIPLYTFYFYLGSLLTGADVSAYITKFSRE